MSGVERLSIQDHDVKHPDQAGASKPSVDTDSRVWKLQRWVEQSSNRSVELIPITSSTLQQATQQDPVPSTSSQTHSARPSCGSKEAPVVPGKGVVTSSAAPSEAHPAFEVWESLSSSSIYYLKHGIYVAFPSKIPIPVGALDTYEKEIEENLLCQLEVAFRAVEQAACRSGSTIDWVSERVSLQMIGKDRDHAANIKLSPRICVRCPKSQKRYMEKAMQDYSLKWISRSIFGPIMVLTAAELSGSNYPPFIWELGKESVPISTRTETEGEGGLFVQGIQKSLVVQLHIGIPERAESLHGAFCRATVIHHGRALAQSYSRIGGLVNSGTEILGITTAHHMLDGFWHEITDLDLVKEPESLPTNDDGVSPLTSDEISTANNDNQEYEDSSDDDYDPRWPHPIRPVDTEGPAEITNWTQVHLYLGTSFSTAAMVSLDEKWTVMFRMYQEAAFSDFALVRLPADWVATNFLNIRSHTLRPKISPVPLRGNERHGSSDTLVQIVLGVDGIIEGALNPGYHNLVIRGQQFTTRVIDLGRLLPRGSSGAWVMRAHKICGMIVAVSPNEPFAYMIAADKLQQDLNRVSRSASRKDCNLTFIQPVGSMRGRRHVGPRTPVRSDSH